MTDNATPVEVTIRRIQARIEKVGTKDPLRAAVLAHQAVEEWEGARPDLARLRRSYVRAASAAGVSLVDIGKALNLSKQRIHQIMDAGK